jgi:hypothetical protein
MSESSSSSRTGSSANIAAAAAAAAAGAAGKDILAAKACIKVNVCVGGGVLEVDTFTR